MVLNDAFTAVINGVSYVYRAVAADVTAGGSSSTAQRIAAGWNALASFASAYTATATGNLIRIQANGFGDIRPVFSCVNAGTGSAGLTAGGPAFTGGVGGASVSVKSHGGAIGTGAAPSSISVGGFISQVGGQYSNKNV